MSDGMEEEVTGEGSGAVGKPRSRKRGGVSPVVRASRPVGDTIESGSGGEGGDNKPLGGKLDLANLSREILDGTERRILVEMAKHDCPEGFEGFYELVFGVKLPKHALREWIKPMYEAKKKRKGMVVKAFRGSTKTTTVTIGFTAFRIGHEPHKANLLIQVGDDIAQDNTASIARIIEANPAWKEIFPNIVPDYPKGWGAGGYEVQRKGDAKWGELNAKRKDPTLVGLGYSSRAIIGKHPDGLLVLDDIHDENNTSSEKELSNVLQILNGTILKTRVDSTWLIAIGTPWVEGDVLDYLEDTEMFEIANTPVYRINPLSSIVFRGENVDLSWPEIKHLKFLEEEYALDQTPGKVEFNRMLLLDLTKIQQRYFTWQPYKSEDISPNSPMAIGCDYAGTSDELKNRLGDNDYFCLAYVMKLSQGGAVVYDGVRERCTQDKAEMYILSAQSMFRGHTTTVVELDGAGETFYQKIRRNPSLRLLGMKSGGERKAKRLERYLQPALASGKLKISDAHTPFLDALRKELSDYPNGKHDDTLDSVYWALRGMPDVMMGEKVFEEIPVGFTRTRKPNPLNSLARR